MPRVRRSSEKELPGGAPGGEGLSAVHGHSPDGEADRSDERGTASPPDEAERSATTGEGRGGEEVRMGTQDRDAVLPPVSDFTVVGECFEYTNVLKAVEKVDELIASDLTVHEGKTGKVFFHVYSSRTWCKHEDGIFKRSIRPQEAVAYWQR